MIVVLVEWLIKGDNFAVTLWGLPLLPWGYLQYRLCGQYRTRHGGGGPGFDVPPNKIVDTGIYAYTRNPMYLGHLIFMTGLAVTLNSILALGLLLFHIFWFHHRVLGDEKHLKELFGDEYVNYMSTVRRWIPGLI